MQKSTNIDEYISQFPKETRDKLLLIQTTIKKIAPQAAETISYGIPTFKLKKNLVHFAGYKNHIGFYPGASGIAKFRKEFTNYKFSKGAVQFPLNQPLPLELITRIVQFRVKETMGEN